MHDTSPPAPYGAGQPDLSQSLHDFLRSLTRDIARIADKMDPPPADKVGTAYVAQRLGVTTTWVADMARKGCIPAACVVHGTGNGKPWKFHRRQIDLWIESR